MPTADLWSTTLAVLSALAATSALLDGVLIRQASRLGRASQLERALRASPIAVVGLLVALTASRLLAGVAVGPIGRRIGQWTVVAVGGAAAALLTPALLFAHTSGAAALVAIGIGIATAPVATTHVALLVDTTEPGGRARVVAIHAAARGAGLAIGAVLGWKVAVVLAFVGAVPALVSLRQRSDDVVPATNPVARMSRLRSRSALTSAIALLGFAQVGLALTVQSFFQQHRVHASNEVLAATIGLLALPVAGRFADRRDRLTVAAAGLALFAAAIGLTALMPNAALITAALALALGGVAAATIALAVLFTEVIPAPLRTDALGIAGLVGAFWGLTSAVLASAARSAWGPGAVLAVVGIGSLGAAAMLLTNREQVAEDLMTVALEAEDRGRARSSSALTVSHVSFAYGTQPVLFDVGLEVAEGEIAALLGTNGAGKSTLLRLVAGLDHPHRGTIRLFGEDTTFLEAEQVLDVGVALLAGGRMTFPGLTVAENLRVGAPRSAEDDAFEAFPALVSRRDQRAGTLSGGEQQMLALARVLVRKPRLLLLDELTLGLAPRIVEQLLATVRRLNAEGTTVLLVEQSANLALSLATHAFFMERGTVRFDGPADELVGRDDLLRPVFLGS